MRLIVEIDLYPSRKGHTMTLRRLKAVKPRIEGLGSQDRDLMKSVVKEAVDQILQTEMTEFLGAALGNERRVAATTGRATTAGAW